MKHQLRPITSAPSAVDFGFSHSDNDGAGPSRGVNTLVATGQGLNISVHVFSQGHAYGRGLNMAGVDVVIMEVIFVDGGECDGIVGVV